jgi:hypothetical protein
MKFQLGPLDFRFYQGTDNDHSWTNAEIAFVTNRHGGKARRETAIRAGVRSDHLVDMIGKDLASDTFECPETGTLYFGKIVQTPTGTYVISAKDVYTRAVYERACKEGLKLAEQATAGLEPANAKA